MVDAAISSDYTGMDLRHIDLNLLVACDVLLEETSVTKAAERLHITQPAMSQTLKRLRDVFDDPLLIRQGGRMVPSPRAQELAPSLRRALAELQAVLDRRPSFEPKTSQRTFTLATTDYVGTVLLPPLFARLHTEAPNVTLLVQSIHAPRYALALENGEYELALSVLEDQPGIERTDLFEEGWATLAAPNHPILKRITARRFAAFPHVLMSPHGGGIGPIDRQLAQQGLKRHVMLRVPAFSLGPPVVATSSALMTMPRRLAVHYAEALGLAQFPLPFELPPFFIHQAWHTRFSADPGHRWLRERIAEVANAL